MFLSRPGTSKCILGFWNTLISRYRCLIQHFDPIYFFKVSNYYFFTPPLLPRSHCLEPREVTCSVTERWQPVSVVADCQAWHRCSQFRVQSCLHAWCPRGPGEGEIPWNWSCRWLWTMWVLGIELWCSGKAASDLNCRAISSACFFYFCSLCFGGWTLLKSMNGEEEIIACRCDWMRQG